MREKILTFGLTVMLLVSVSLIAVGGGVMDGEEEEGAEDNVRILDDIIKSDNSLTSDYYVDNILLEVRMNQGVGVGDTATGVLDAFLQAVEGPIYDGVRDEWKANLRVLESYGYYNNLFFNTAYTEDCGYVVDADDNGDLMFNVWTIREIRYATNWLISRQYVVEDIYEGYGIAQYSAIGQKNPAWNEKLQPVIDDHGITYSGDFNKAYDMIQDAMTEAMNDTNLTGELRAPVDSPTDFWQYRPPDGDWTDVETHGLIRIEDRRHEIGHYFSDRLETSGIKVYRDDMDRHARNIWLWSDAADMQWGFYTGGWVSSASTAYQHSILAKMYTNYSQYMPGDAYMMNIDSNARYAYSRDEDVAEMQYELATLLMDGTVPDMDTYWDIFVELLDIGVNESVRVFIQSGIDYYPLNRDRITEVAPDLITGWSEVFSPRTIKTQDGNFRAAQFSAGQLYMDNWNNIAGFSCPYSLMQARMSRDFATTMHPTTGTPIGMRAEWVEVFKDYEYDQNGTLVTNLDIPSDAVNYDVFNEEWYEVGFNKTAATSVKYTWHFGTWHSGHDFTMQDLVSYYAFGKQLSWNTDAGDHYHVGSWIASQTYYNNIHGIIFDEANDTVTVYGDYTFPMDPQIGGYYMWMPEVPWQLYEAASQLIGMTDLAPATTLNNQPYSWSSAPGRNYVHWLSTAQGNDFDATLANIASEGWVPPYLRADRNSPIPLGPGDVGSDIGDIRAFFAEYEHHWITHGPFKLTVHDPANLVIEMERWTQADGYPWPEDYWRSKIHVVSMGLGTLTVPRTITQGEEINLGVRARVAEEYPVRLTRDLVDGDDYEVTATLEHFGNIVWKTDEVSLVNSHFEVTIPKEITAQLEPKAYEVKINAKLDAQLAYVQSTAGIRILENFMDIPLSIDSEAEGWNFVSFNLKLNDTSLAAILDHPENGISGNYDKVMYYDASEDEWMSYVPGRENHFNNLNNWNHKMGIWICITDDVTLTVVGTLPLTSDITLYPGWNMVGYPSNTNRIASEILPTEVTKVGVFNRYAPYNVEYEYDLSYVLLGSGRGYWLYNGADEPVIWTVEY